MVVTCHAILLTESTRRSAFVAFRFPRSADITCLCENVSQPLLRSSTPTYLLRSISLLWPLHILMTWVVGESRSSVGMRNSVDWGLIKLARRVTMRLFTVRGHWETMVGIAIHRPFVVRVSGEMPRILDRDLLWIVLAVAAGGVVHRARGWELLIAIRGACRCRGTATAGEGRLDRDSSCISDWSVMSGVWLRVTVGVWVDGCIVTGLRLGISVWGRFGKASMFMSGSIVVG